MSLTVATKIAMTRARIRNFIAQKPIHRVDTPLPRSKISRTMTMIASMDIIGS